MRTSRKQIRLWRPSSNLIMNFSAFAFAGNQKDGPLEEASAEPIAEEDMMENARVTYEVFVQNNLESTSHSLQWLPKLEQ